MIIAGKLAKIGNKILNVIAAAMIFLLMLFGSFSLYDTWYVYNHALADKELLKYKPKSDQQEDLSLLELAKINDDVIGWITVDDTHIDYPLVQGKDILEYVNKDVYGNFSLSGSIFVDTRNNPLFTDPYTLTYGHHIANGAMYGDVIKFEEKSYFEKHQTGTLYMLDGTQKKFTIFACVVTTASNTVVFNPTESKEGNLALLQDIQNNAVQMRSVPQTKRILGLSTCEDASTLGRTIVYAYIDD